MTLNLYKVILRCLNPTNDIIYITFWAYNMGELKAREAAMAWGVKEMGNSSTITVEQIDIVT